MLSSLVFYSVVFYIVYKILDYLLRIPRVGNYSERHILVTGCDTGFGNLLVRRLDNLGCHVFAGCLTETGETELKKVCSNRLHTIPLDVTKKESVRKAFEYVKSKLPENRGLWGVVNNAGVMHKIGPNAWLTVDDFKHLCDINLFGMIDVSLTFLPLVKKEKGRFVNMSSAAGRASFPSATTYSVSKYGVEAFTDGLRRELQPFGCKAILIEPGAFKTPAASKDAFKDYILRALKDAPEEAKEEFGQEFINYYKDVLPNLFGDNVSDRTYQVIDAYEHALLGQYPRIRYLVGLDMNLFFFPIQAVPDRLGDWMWRIVQKDVPLPAAALAKR